LILQIKNESGGGIAEFKELSVPNGFDSRLNNLWVGKDTRRIADKLEFALRTLRTG
jgi:hypothetical protein